MRQFADVEADEQTVVAQAITNEVNPPPAPLDAVHRRKRAALQATPAGKAFDAAYVTGQIEGPHELGHLHQAYLDVAPTNLDNRHIAMPARWSIQQHLVMPGFLRQAMIAAER